MKVIGKMIYSMDKVKKPGQMDHYMKENILGERSMVLVYTLGMMALVMKENGLKIKYEE